MKRVILTVVAVVFCLLSSRALTLQEYQQQDGRPCACHILSPDELMKARPGYPYKYRYQLPMELWSIALQDSNMIVDFTSVSGLMADDFNQFFHEHEISKFSPLKRETDEYRDTYHQMRNTFDEAKSIFAKSQIYVLIDTSIWYSRSDYDLETESFTFELPSKCCNLEDPILDKIAKDFLYVDKYKIHINKENFGILTSVEKEDWDRFTLKTYKKTVTTREFKVFIKNKNVALSIEENKPDFDPIKSSISAYDYDLLAKCNLIEDGSDSHLALEDIILLNNSTKEVVWTAKTGDHSNEITALK